MTWSKEHQRFFLLQVEVIDVWDIFEEQKVS